MDQKTIDTLLELASKANNPQELYSMAKEAGINMPKEQAADVYARLQDAEFQLSEEELEAVVGGAWFTNAPSTCSDGP